METVAGWKIVFLGFLQGATEFLPVSSSGHLVIAQQFLNLSREGVFLLALDVALHFGTLGAVLVYFWRDIASLVRAFVRPAQETETQWRMVGYLVLGTLPAAVIGLVFKGFFEELFADAIPASFFLLLTGAILWLTKWVQYDGIRERGMGWPQALLVGAAQACAIIPGISRSGTTIAMGLFLKMHGETAVRFSFLLAVPAIFGATLLEFKQLITLPTATLLPVVTGVLAAFVTGYFSIRLVFRFVRRHQFHRFCWYCWGVGLLVLLKELAF